MTGAPIEHLLRDLAPQVLAAAVRRYRDFAACEDAVQEALLAASEQWPRHGVPDEPRAWLVTVTRRRMADHVRRETARRNREALVSAAAPSAVDRGEPFAVEADDTLALFFTCCHPALTASSAIALTLRAVGGLTTAEIARAFLVPALTMSQRISRAKQTIAASGVRLSVPEGGQRSERLGAVLHVLYLMFNEGYTASAGDSLHRVDLSNEAIRLTRIVHGMLPDDPGVAGLLALMLLTDARRAARTGPAGELIPLDEQDRSLWNRPQIREGVALVSAALRLGPPGEYQVLAAIAAVHDEAPRAEDTDWPQIAALYEVLLRIADSPMARLNHAVAVAMVEGPEAGLALLEPLGADGRLADHHRLDAVRAHLHERAGDVEGAATLYRRAAAKTTSTPERSYLLTRAARLAG